MHEEALAAIAARMRPMVEAHWRSCLEHGLDGHSAEAHAAVNQCMQQYFQDLGRLPRQATDAPILEVMRSLFERFDQIQERFGSGLMETDERELLVPSIIEAAQTVGLDSAKFDDPTSEFRNF